MSAPHKLEDRLAGQDHERAKASGAAQQRAVLPLEALELDPQLALEAGAALQHRVEGVQLVQPAEARDLVGVPRLLGKRAKAHS